QEEEHPDLLIFQEAEEDGSEEGQRVECDQALQPGLPRPGRRRRDRVGCRPGRWHDPRTAQGINPDLSTRRDDLRALPERTAAVVARAPNRDLEFSAPRSRR